MFQHFQLDLSIEESEKLAKLLIEVGEMKNLIGNQILLFVNVITKLQSVTI